MRGRIWTGPRGYPGAFNKASRAMLESGGGGDFSAAMVNSILLALWAILPALAVAYARQRALAPRRRPEFMLQKSERSELKRAVELYGQVRQRLEQIREGNELINSFWRTALRRHSSIPEQNEELEDLKAYADDLSPERPAAFTTEIVDRQQKRAIRIGLRDRGLLCEFRSVVAARVYDFR